MRESGLRDLVWDQPGVKRRSFPLVLVPARLPTRQRDDFYISLLARSDFEIGRLIGVYTDGLHGHDVMSGGNIAIERATQFGRPDISPIGGDRRKALAGIGLVIAIEPDPSLPRRDRRNDVRRCHPLMGAAY